MKHHPSCKPNDRSLIYKCSQCGLEESADVREAYLLDVIEQGIELMGLEEQWPGFLSNLKTVHALMTGEMDEVPKAIVEQLRQLGKLP